MGLTFGASRAEGSGGVTLGQLNEVLARATAEATSQGIDPMEVEPKVQVSLGGRIKKIEIALP